MGIKVKVKEQQLNSFLKLTCIIGISDGPNMKCVTDQFNVNDLVSVRLNFACNGMGSPLVCSILSWNLKTDDECKVKVKVSCQETDIPFYSEWVCDKKWKRIGERLSSDTILDDVYINVININITTCKVEESRLTKIYNDVDFTDFNLSAVDGSVAIHRTFLAAHSDVFRAMLRNEWKEANEGCVQIEGVTRQTLQHLKDYMYLRTLPDEGLEPLLLLASYYLMDDLKEQCVSKLALNCTLKDWSRLLEFAAVNKISELISGLMLTTQPTAVQKQKGKDLEDKQ
ncbi:uncharacterized protein LOC125234730 [Leguminivora glycinivorella]|uniref:uncharacterized protein LOC125234730 n=1 Tax=Leguminivora glycinivorella TaxID=1035111 RepID=UPI00200EA181|nr:uncharacterized protein LOC125234730 [Leguminivora glycinivorella]